MTSKILKIVFLLSLFGLSAQTFAIVDSEEPEKEEELVEVIEVTGKRPLGWYRKQITLTQMAYFKQLNSMIEDKQYHVKCEPVFRRESLWNLNKVGTKNCKPRFVSSLMNEIIQESTGYTGRMLRIPPSYVTEYARRYKKKHAELMKMAEEAAMESPELAKLLQEATDAQLEYKYAHYMKFGRWSKYARELQGEDED